MLAAVLATGACKETAAPDGEFTITPGVAEIFIGGDVQLTAIGAPSVPAWSSSNSQVATVVTETGWVMGVGQGTATISAVAGGAVAIVDVTVLRPPAIAISQPTVDFFMDVGGANPANQTVTVNNAGDGTLSGVTVQSITYGPNNPGPWLTVSGSGDTAPVTLTLSADGQGFPRGVYTATVQIGADGVANSPQSLAVMLHVQRDPEIAVSRTTVPMAGIPGVTINETVELTNAGDKTLDGLAVEVRDPPAQPGNWLTATLDATTAPTTIRLTASTANLPVGSWTTVVHVTSTVAGVAPVDIDVNITVSPGPAIAVSASTVSFQANTGTNPGNQTVDITNAGGGSLTGMGLGAITYGAGQPTGWLTAMISGTIAPATITLSVMSSALPQGSYTATVPITSPVASNSPFTLTVNLNVGPPPVISLNPVALVFGSWTNGSASPGQAIQVTNGAAGGGPLTGLSYSVTYGIGANGWLNLSWQNGQTDAPATLLVTPNTASIPRGTYTAQIEFKSTMPNVAPDTLTVTYIIQAFSVDIGPQMGGCLGGGCHSATAPVLSNASTRCTTLKSGGYVMPGNGVGSTVYRVLSGLAPGHSGGTFPSLAVTIRQWIDRLAPCS
jgi:hypothetical protein